MAYFAAVISLKQTIKRLLNSSHISIPPSDGEIIKFAGEKVVSLRRVLDELESRRNDIRSKRLESLHEQIRDAVYGLEDALDTHVSDQFLSQSEKPGDKDSNSLTFSLDVSNEVLMQEIDNFADMVEKLEKECSKLSNDSLSEEDDDDDDVDSSRIDYVGPETQMVGLSHEYSWVKEELLKDDRHEFDFFLINGMAGIGKTTMAKKIYHDPEICNHFNCRLWVTVGQKFQFRKILLYLLAQLDYDVDDMQEDGDEKLGNYLSASLRSKRYLIMMDDVWTESCCHELRRYLPTDDKISHVLILSRTHVFIYTQAMIYTMRFLNEEESWCLLREKVFGEKPCSYRLEKAGKKFAKNCDGLPLLIVTVADLLSKAEKTVEYWFKIAEGEDKSIFIKANDEISDTLLRSYKYLHQRSKAFFLYMAVFPLKCVIPALKLYNLWLVEDICRSKNRVNGARHILLQLVLSNLVLADQDAAVGELKTCGLHSSFWYACVKQSWKEKFLHVINSSADTSREGAISRRRLGVHNNVLFGIKEAYDSIESISSARSLICSGPYHQYPVKICFGLRLLKVLDVLSVRFYKFPIEVLRLIHLRYLALTYNGKIPPSISKFWNLEYLIICQHLSIKFLGDWLYLSVEIWKMKKLRHLQVTGNCLPYLCKALLPKLIKLSGINVHSCTEEIFRRIPNLKKLGVQIDLVLNSDTTEPLSYFNHLSHLDRLESLKFVIVNPNPARPQVIAPPPSVETFPSYLKKLSLSGFGYPWNYMRVIGQLPNLRALKLRSYAFRGPNWKICKGEFLQLRYLLLEDIDLVNMTFHNSNIFSKLETLIIKHCYKFKRIPLRLRNITTMEIVDSPLIEKYMQEKATTTLRISFEVDIRSSWKEEERKA